MLTFEKAIQQSVAEKNWHVFLDEGFSRRV